MDFFWVFIIILKQVVRLQFDGNPLPTLDLFRPTKSAPLATGNHLPYLFLPCFQYLFYMVLHSPQATKKPSLGVCHFTYFMKATTSTLSLYISLLARLKGEEHRKQIQESKPWHSTSPYSSLTLCVFSL